MRRSAFTLVELLVTIAIIAILVAILLPSLAAARKSARLTAGSANLRSCGQVLLTYTNDNRGDFLNPFRPSWPADMGDGSLGWTDVVSPTDSSIYWRFRIMPSYNTDEFATYWYSYLADYRAGGRLTAEMFSPADPQASAVTKDFEAVASRQQSYLVGSSFMYSPAFWTKAEAISQGQIGASKLRTANMNGVLTPTKKVMIWEATDFRSAAPRFYASLGARPIVMTVDGSISEADIDDISKRTAAGELSAPIKFALGGGPGILESNQPRGEFPDVVTGAPGYFAYTWMGIQGKDLP